MCSAAVRKLTEKVKKRSSVQSSQGGVEWVREEL